MSKATERFSLDKFRYRNKTSNSKQSLLTDTESPRRIYRENGSPPRSSLYTFLSSPSLNSQDSDVTCIPETPTSEASSPIFNKSKRLTHQPREPFSSDDDKESLSSAGSLQMTKNTEPKMQMKSLGGRKFRLISTESESSDTEIENDREPRPVSKKPTGNPVTGRSSFQQSKEDHKRTASGTRGALSSKFNKPTRGQDSPGRFAMLPSSSSDTDTDVTTLGSRGHRGVSELETPPPTVVRRKKRRRILSESQESNEGEGNEEETAGMTKDNIQDVLSDSERNSNGENGKRSEHVPPDSPKAKMKTKKRQRIQKSPSKESSEKWLSKSKMTAYFPTLHKPSTTKAKTKDEPINERKDESLKMNDKKRRRIAQDVPSSDDETFSLDQDSDDDDEDRHHDGDDSSSEMNQLILSFFNDATDEELLCINFCSKAKVKKIVALRPFEDHNDLLTKIQTKGLGMTLVWNCAEMIESQQVMTSLLDKCSKVADRIQTIISKQLPGKDDRQCEETSDGQITQQPALLNDKFSLKPYQLIGINWLSLMHSQGLNGILADEMGLGKTVQTIAFLSHLMEQGDTGPHLIVVPSSTLENWVRELKTWCPALEVVLYTGSVEERRELRANILAEYLTCNVIITSYNMCISNADDRSLFRKMSIHYVVFDEAHMLKNMQSQRYKFLMRIRAERKLLLTGTPLQNNLKELIALLSFVMPAMFVDCAEDLQKIFSLTKQKSENPLEQSAFERERIAHAKQIMKPFVLRRIKSEVLRQLPQKTECIVHCPMIKTQQACYDSVKADLSRDLRRLGDGAKMQSNHLSCAMMQLRKAANHELLMRKNYDDKKLRVMSKLMLKEPTHYDAEADLIFEDMSVMTDFELHRLCYDYNVLKPYRLNTDVVVASGKFQQLDVVLPELKQKGSRVLMFSQFVMVLDLIEVYMKQRGHRYLRLDGQTPVCERLTMIDKYNNDDNIFVFLLSTRAGGLGINLTAANHVILHDIDYNPYNDKQAEDRCHRVGQKRNVTVTKLITSNSIEEGMLRCAKYKLQLEEQMTTNQTTDGDKDNHVDIATLLKDALDL